MAKPRPTSTYVDSSTRVGSHHLAYLRAIAEGLPRQQAAERYLGVDPHDGLVALRRTHQSVVDRVRAIARRLGEARWRLIGLDLRTDALGERPPSIDAWADARGLDGFGHEELLALYLEAHPPDRKASRNARLRTQQLAALQSLQHSGTSSAQPHHRIDEWLAPNLAQALMAGGLQRLSDLQERIERGGRWWSSVPRIGAGKAARLARQLEALLPGSATAAGDTDLLRRGQSLALALTPTLSHGPTPGDGAALSPAPAPARARGTAPDIAASDQSSDLALVQAWIAARAGRPATVKAYRREMARFLLFLEQRGCTLPSCTAADLDDYAALLRDPPPAWVSPRGGRRGDRNRSGVAGFAGLAGPLSDRSRQQALSVVGACFAWLHGTQRLAGNPWRAWRASAAAASPAPRGPSLPTDRAAAGRMPAPAVWKAVLDQLRQASSPAARRTLFVLDFLSATGLRASELLAARLGDLAWQDGHPVLRVGTAAQRPRTVPLVPRARVALEQHLAQRDLGWDAAQQAPALPLLASLRDPLAPIGYRVLLSSMETWLGKAIGASGLQGPDRTAAARARPHGLRQAFGTRALAQGLPLPVVGELLGHADWRSTARYAASQSPEAGRVVALALERALERAFD